MRQSGSLYVFTGRTSSSLYPSIFIGSRYLFQIISLLGLSIKPMAHQLNLYQMRQTYMNQDFDLIHTEFRSLGNRSLFKHLLGGKGICGVAIMGL